MEMYQWKADLDVNNLFGKITQHYIQKLGNIVVKGLYASEISNFEPLFMVYLALKGGLSVLEMEVKCQYE